MPRYARSDVSRTASKGDIGQYLLVFRQIGIKVYDFHARQLQVLVHHGCAQLVGGKLQAKEERRAGLGGHRGCRGGVKWEAYSASKEK